MFAPDSTPSSRDNGNSTFTQTTHRQTFPFSVAPDLRRRLVRHRRVTSACGCQRTRRRLLGGALTGAIGAAASIGPDPRAIIRQTHAFQVGPQKRRPDIGHHFMIGPDGSVWETRAGSLAGPVVADATGGSQDYAQLVCMIGDFRLQPPTPAAQESLMRTLIHLADRYDVDTDPAATSTFVSPGRTSSAPAPRSRLRRSPAIVM